MILQIDHTAISVPDMQKALDFYCGVLGFEVLFEAGWPVGSKPLDDLVGLADSSTKVAMVQLADTKIEIFEYATPEPAPQDPDRPVSDHGITHLAFQVTDLPAEYERLKAAGVRFNSEPIDMGAQLLLYGRDPFGNTLELMESKA